MVFPFMEYERMVRLLIFPNTEPGDGDDATAMSGTTYRAVRQLQLLLLGACLLPQERFILVDAFEKAKQSVTFDLLTTSDLTDYMVQGLGFTICGNRLSRYSR